MRPYNIEIFDPNLMYRSHYQTDSISYKTDYLDPEKSAVSLSEKTKCEDGDYIVITKGGFKAFGIVTAIADSTNEQRKVTMSDFGVMWDIDIVVDTQKDGSGTLERYVADRIAETYVRNPDATQNIAGLAVEANGDTDTWSLGLEPNTDDNHYAIVNLFDDIILPAFLNYEVIVYLELDVMAKKIRANVTRNRSPVKVIEADLRNIISKEVTILKARKETNKLVIYNKKDFEKHTTFFLYRDGSYGQKDMNRITPVKLKIATVSTKTKEEYEEKQQKNLENAVSRIARIQKTDVLDDADRMTIVESVGILNAALGTELQIGADGKVLGWDENSVRTALNAYTGTYQFEKDCRALSDQEFQKTSADKAAAVFTGNKYENLIEVEVQKEDPLVLPEALKIGQRVNVISGGERYESVLTGKEMSDTIKLSFGNIRLELTKMLRGRG